MPYRYGKPMLVLGGGGYTIRNVARCWCYETACCCNVELPDQVSVLCKAIVLGRAYDACSATVQ
jgi:hypothetical protein